MMKNIKLSLLSLVFPVIVYAQGAGGYQAVEQLRMLQNHLDSGNKAPDKVFQAGNTNQNNLDMLKKQLSAMQPKEAQSFGAGSPVPESSKPESASKPPEATQPSPLPSVPYQQQIGSANKNNIESQEDNQMIDELAFEQVENQLFPMSEKNIKNLRTKYQDIELANSAAVKPASFKSFAVYPAAFKAAKSQPEIRRIAAAVTP